MKPPKPRPKRRRARSYDEVLRAAILRLPTNQRDVFVLHRFAGLTYGEIGLRLGLTPEAVQARFAAAMVRLVRAVRNCEP
ncbi:RNA polymerase sigma factor [Brevundimonas sp.]|uniref:RNA polymerase sigma factor n=1 Tax=Brevundimonas sp. TaxID=1871086 RepID=UPI00351D4A2F